MIHGKARFVAACATGVVKLLLLAMISIFSVAPGRAVEPAAIVEPYHVGVWYFTLWSRAATSVQVSQGMKIYGRADAWAGVRDYAEGHGAFVLKAPPDAFAERRPLLGFYDLMDQATVDAQIREAASEGIEFLAFYWYFDPLTGLEKDVSAPVAKFFASPVRDRIKFVLAPIALGEAGQKLSLETWRNTLMPKLVDAMASDAYLQLEGRPALVDFSLPFATAEEKAQAYAELREGVRERLGVSPLILALLGPDHAYAQEEFVRLKEHPDGFTCFHFNIARPAEPYDEMTRGWIGDMRVQIAPPQGAIDSQTLYVPCGSIGQDARPWYGMGGGEKAQLNEPEARAYTLGTTPEAFERHLRDLKSFIDAGEVRTLNTVILYAWNEWGEAAASIEPSQALGYRYADVVRKVFGLIPRGERPPAAE